MQGGYTVIRTLKEDPRQGGLEFPLRLLSDVSRDSRVA
jgi:hypothetical protein